ncbi:MAG: hypothetical protein ACI8T1_000573 [Verrucomicrobiales bacterium]|jgi:hypothetical protein
MVGSCAASAAFIDQDENPPIDRLIPSQTNPAAGSISESKHTHTHTSLFELGSPSVKGFSVKAMIDMEGPCFLQGPSPI